MLTAALHFAQILSQLNALLAACGTISEAESGAHSDSDENASEPKFAAHYVSGMAALLSEHVQRATQLLKE